MTQLSRELFPEALGAMIVVIQLQRKGKSKKPTSLHIKLQLRE